MIRHTLNAVRTLAFAACGGAHDATSADAADRAIGAALRAVKAAKARNNAQAAETARALVAELNETRRLFRAGHYKRGRLALRAASALVAAFCATHAGAAPSQSDKAQLAALISSAAPICMPHADMIREAEGRGVIMVRLPLERFQARMAWRLAVTDTVADILDHGPKVYTVEGPRRARVFLTDGATACTSRALTTEMRGKREGY